MNGKATPWLAVVLAMLAGGCQPSTASKPDDDLGAEKYARLPGLSASPDPELCDELARIVEEKGTPELLMAAAIPDDQNVAAGLADLFPAAKVESVRREADQVAPPRKLGFRFDSIRLQRAVDFRKQYDRQRQEARIALERPRCNFGLRHVAGAAADLSWVDVVWIFARLEQFQAAEYLHDEDLDAAAESLRYLLRLAQCLAAEKHVVPRGQAAMIRDEGLLVLEAVVHHPKVAKTHLQKLAGLLDAQLAQWPPDADAWIGDRALGMHDYEFVRDGQLLTLLRPEDLELFGGKDVIRDLPDAARRTVNEDELYYLRTMRKIIDSCRRPLYQRAAVLQAIRADLRQKQGTAEFPTIAGHLLLPGIDKGQMVQARDRAYCEGWALALALGSGRPRPPYQVDPLTGAEYRVIREHGRVEVSGPGTGLKDDDPRMIVPDMAGQPP
jgi:hypothetical protein